MSASLNESVATFVEPMLCLPARSLPVGAGWQYEIKWDGYRSIACKVGREVNLYSRNGKSLDDDFPELVKALRSLKCRSAVVDGEIVAFDEEGRPSFQLLQKRSSIRQVRFVAFDLVTLNGKGLQRMPLSIRHKSLHSILPAESAGLLSFSAALRGRPEGLIEKARKMGLEGIVAKKVKSYYESGERSGFVEWTEGRKLRHPRFVRVR